MFRFGRIGVLCLALGLAGCGKPPPAALVTLDFRAIALPSEISGPLRLGASALAMPASPRQLVVLGQGRTSAQPVWIEQDPEGHWKGPPLALKDARVSGRLALHADGSATWLEQQPDSLFRIRSLGPPPQASWRELSQQSCPQYSRVAVGNNTLVLVGRTADGGIVIEKSEDCGEQWNELILKVPSPDGSDGVLGYTAATLAEAQVDSTGRLHLWMENCNLPDVHGIRKGVAYLRNPRGDLCDRCQFVDCQEKPAPMAMGCNDANPDVIYLAQLRTEGIEVAVSQDGGTNWHIRKMVGPESAGASQIKICGYANHVVVCWYARAGKERAVWTAYSRDAGQNWGQAQPLEQIGSQDYGLALNRGTVWVWGEGTGDPVLLGASFPSYP